MISSLGFKAFQSFKVLFALGGGIHVTCYLRSISDATPTDLLVANMAANLFSSMYLHVPASIYFEC